MGSMFGGRSDPDDQESRRYPILIIGVERAVSRMLMGVCHALGYRTAATYSTIEGLDYLAGHRDPHLLIISAGPQRDDDPGMLRYLSGNPALRHRVGIIVYAGFDATPQRRLAPRQQRLVNAWLTFPHSVETLQECIATASLALSLHLADQRGNHS